MSAELSVHEMLSANDYFESDAHAVELLPVTPGELNLDSEERTSVQTISLEERAAQQYMEQHEPKEQPVCIEECIRISSGDSRNAIAFAIAFNELTSRMQASSRFPVARWHHSGRMRREDVRPSLMDYSAECFRAARESLSMGEYLVLKAHADHDFTQWHKIDADLRKTIANKVGRTLRKKRVVANDSTREYFTKHLSRWAA